MASFKATLNFSKASGPRWNKRHLYDPAKVLLEMCNWWECFPPVYPEQPRGTRNVQLQLISSPWIKEENHRTAKENQKRDPNVLSISSNSPLSLQVIFSRLGTGVQSCKIYIYHSCFNKYCFPLLITEERPDHRKRKFTWAG